MRTEDEKRFDIRLTDRNLRDGAIEPSDLEKEAAGLEDLTEQADWIPYDEITSMRVAPLAAREQGDEERPAED